MLEWEDILAEAALTPLPHPQEAPTCPPFLYYPDPIISSFAVKTFPLKHILAEITLTCVNRATPQSENVIDVQLVFGEPNTIKSCTLEVIAVGVKVLGVELTDYKGPESYEDLVATKGRMHSGALGGTLTVPVIPVNVNVTDTTQHSYQVQASSTQAKVYPRIKGNKFNATPDTAHWYIYHDGLLGEIDGYSTGMRFKTSHRPEKFHFLLKIRFKGKSKPERYYCHLLGEHLFTISPT